MSHPNPIRESEAMLPFVDPASGDPLELRATTYYNSRTQRAVASVQGGIPRFVAPGADYAESFGYQWHRWRNLRNHLHSPGFGLRQEIMQRTHFDQFDLSGQRLLECGMGAGDDTGVLLGLPLAELHAFDLSRSVERAYADLHDPRLRIFQGSIYDIPYPDGAFDVVYCHRVLQHTPDPQAALRQICAKVRPGGLLFAHAYKRSARHMAEWRYKYRWLTRRLPLRVIDAYVDLLGTPLHHLNELAARHPFSRDLAYRFLPFYRKEGAAREGMTQQDLIELEKLITFDALTPFYDQPMSSEEFLGTISAAGFEILHRHDPEGSPIYCTARRHSATP